MRAACSFLTFIVCISATGSVRDIPESREAYVIEARQKAVAWERKLGELERRGGRHSPALDFMEERLASVRLDIQELEETSPKEWKNVGARIEGKFDKLQQTAPRVMAE